MTTPLTLLQVQHLSFTYPDDSPLLTAWSASVTAGLTLLHGDSGSGKSTLLRLLAGTQTIKGRLTLNGIRFDHDPAAYRRALFWREPATTE
ncbi:MAG: transporter, partial [Rhizobacter sp.]|nr:transporter [Rhizobacter sp.]